MIYNSSKMISLGHFKQFNRRSILLGLGCAVLLGVSLFGIHLARTS
jgi:hypothetical protein